MLFYNKMRRIDSIKSSGIRKIFEKAAKIEGLINLSIGQPDFSVPEKIKKSMINAINNNKTGYTQTDGINELKEKIQKKYKSENPVIITSGVSGGLVLSYSALVEDDAEMIIFSPYFVIYPDMWNFLGGKSVIVKTRNDFSIDFEEFEKAITEKTKAVMINSPCNPTGHVINIDDMKKIIEIAKKHDLWIISDEVYEDFDYEQNFVSINEFDYEKKIILSGFSKNFALTGLRLGYAIGPQEIINDMKKLQQYTFVCAPSIAQHAVAENFDINISDLIDKFKKRRDYVYDNLKDHFEVVKPKGAFYFFVKVGEGDEYVDEGSAFSEKCLAKKLLVVPGSAFGNFKDYIRISYAADMQTLEKGISILIELKKGL